MLLRTSNPQSVVIGAVAILHITSSRESNTYIKSLIIATVVVEIVLLDTNSIKDFILNNHNLDRITTTKISKYLNNTLGRKRIITLLNMESHIDVVFNTTNYYEKSIKDTFWWYLQRHRTCSELA